VDLLHSQYNRSTFNLYKKIIKTMREEIEKRNVRSKSHSKTHPRD